MLLDKLPHVLIILWADIGVPDVSPYVPTKNFAAFKREGVSLDTWITQPIGSHTMYSVLFGEYAIRNGTTHGFSWYGSGAGTPDVRLDTRSLPAAAKAAGYSVALHGKWGIGGNDIGELDEFRNVTPNLHGFSTWSAGIGSNVKSGQGTGYANWERIDDGRVTMSSTWADADIRDEWVSWWLNTQGPRFSVVWFEAAHGPHDVEAPDRFLPPGYFTPSTNPNAPNNPLFLTPRERYESLVVSLDFMLGEMLSHVNFDDTYVFVFSTCGTPDGKPVVAPNPNRVKRTTFEGGIHTPAAVRGPHVARGATAELTSPVDLWATLARVTDIPGPPRESDSVSFAHLLERPDARGSRRYVYSQHREQAIRTDRYKLRRMKNGKEFLYDLELDPNETQAIVPWKHPNQELVRRLRYWLNNPGSGMVVDGELPPVTPRTVESRLRGSETRAPIGGEGGSRTPMGLGPDGF